MYLDKGHTYRTSPRGLWLHSINKWLPSKSAQNIVCNQLEVVAQRHVSIREEEAIGGMVVPPVKPTQILQLNTKELILNQ